MKSPKKHGTKNDSPHQPSLYHDIIILSDAPFTVLAQETYALLQPHFQKPWSLSFPSAGILFSRFKNKESKVKVLADVKGKMVILFKSFLSDGAYNPDMADIELLLANDTSKQAGAKRIINVLPYIPYLRQDRVTSPGEPVSAHLLASMTYLSGASMVITVDMHSEKSRSFYPKVHHVHADHLFVDFLQLKKGKVVVIAPDQGALVRAEHLARQLKLPVAACTKKRDEMGKIVSLECPKISASHAIIFDDMIDSGGTLFQAIDQIKKQGVTAFTVCCTHAILSGDAEEQLHKRKIKLITTNSIPYPRKDVTMLSLTPVLAEAIRKVL